MNAEEYARLLPEITPANQPYWDGCAAGELRLQECDDCGRFRFPDSPCCPQCLSDRYHWQRVSGEGTLWSWIVMHQRYFAAYADELPYLVAYVKLAEGPFLITTLDAPADDLRIDLPVRAVFVTDPAGRMIPRFQIAR